MNNTPQALTDNGWYFHEKCKCKRVVKYLYRHDSFPGLEVEWWVKTFQFRILNGNFVKQGLTSLKQLDTTLKAL